jgi:hypothetical protein
MGGDRQHITVDLQVAGESMDLNSDYIVFKNKGVEIKVETEEPLKPVDGLVSGTVRRAIITTETSIGEDKEIGARFIVQIEATYTEAPPFGSSITVTLGSAPTDELLKNFQDGAQQQGFSIRRFAYTMSVHTFNLNSSPFATITMSASPEWVTTSGRNTVRIMRLADDGTTEMLNTSAAGYDQFGNTIFTADSPHGFSTFGLVSAIQISEPIPINESSKVPATASIEIPATTAVPVLPVSTPLTALPVPWFIAPTLIIVLIGEGLAHLYLISQIRKIE